MEAWKKSLENKLMDPHFHFLLGWGNWERKSGKLLAWDNDLIGKGKATGAKQTQEFLPHFPLQ